MHSCPSIKKIVISEITKNYDNNIEDSVENEILTRNEQSDLDFIRIWK